MSCVLHFSGCIVLAIMLALPARAEGFRHLSGAEIHARLTDKQITDQGHRSQTYARGGSLIVNDLGHPETGTWNIRVDHLCILRPGILDSCYKVWLAAPSIQLRVPGESNALTAVPRKPVAR